MRDEDDHTRTANARSASHPYGDQQVTVTPTGIDKKRPSDYVRRQPAQSKRVTIADRHLSQIFGNLVCEPLGHVEAYSEGLPYYVDEEHPRLSN